MIVRSAERPRAVEEVAARLRQGLDVVAVTLPSPRVDPLSPASDAPYPLVDLGRSSLVTALRLAAVLQGREK